MVFPNTPFDFKSRWFGEKLGKLAKQSDYFCILIPGIALPPIGPSRGIDMVEVRGFPLRRIWSLGTRGMGAWPDSRVVGGIIVVVVVGGGGFSSEMQKQNP